MGTITEYKVVFMSTKESDNREIHGFPRPLCRILASISLTITRFKPPLLPVMKEMLEQTKQRYLLKNI